MELSLGLRTIETFDADAPLPSAAAVQDFRDVALGADDAAPRAAAAGAGPDEAEGAFAGRGRASSSSGFEPQAPSDDSPVPGREQSPGASPGPGSGVKARAAAPKAPGAHVAGNRNAFEDWVRRLGKRSEP